MKISVILLALFLSGCALFKDISYHRTAPGYLAIETSMRDKVRSVSLNPASLFDEDDSISIFRLGFYWEPGMGDDVDFVVSIPSRWDEDVKHVIESIKDLQIIKGDKTVKLQKAKNPVKLKYKRAYGRKEFYLEYRYSGDRKLLNSMLKEKDVRVKLLSVDKIYDGRFDISNNYRARYMNNRHYAYNGANRFIDAINKKESNAMVSTR